MKICTLRHTRLGTLRHTGGRGDLFDFLALFAFFVTQTHSGVDYLAHFHDFQPEAPLGTLRHPLGTLRHRGGEGQKFATTSKSENSLSQSASRVYGFSVLFVFSFFIFFMKIDTKFSPWDKFRSALGTREKTCYRLIREKYA